MANNPSSHGSYGIEEIWTACFQRNSGSDGAIELHYLDGKGDEISVETLTVSSTITGLLGLPSVACPDTTKGVLAYCRANAINMGFAGARDTSASANYTDASPTAPQALAVGQPVAWGIIPPTVRQLVDAWRVSAGVVTTIANGADVTQGAIADASVLGDNSGSVSAKLRGLSTILYDIWDSVNHLFHYNLKQIGGTAVDTNSGVKSAGTQRVVIATDQPALTNALPVKQQSGSITHTQPTVTTATSTTVLAANSSRKYASFQNNDTGDWMINYAGGTLTGIAPSATNLGIVLKPNGSVTFEGSFLPTGAFTAYHTAGSSRNTLSVVEG